LTLGIIKLLVIFISPMKNVLCNKIPTEKDDMNADVQTVTAHATVVYDYDNRKEKNYE